MLNGAAKPAAIMQRKIAEDSDKDKKKKGSSFFGSLFGSE